MSIDTVAVFKVSNATTRQQLVDRFSHAKQTARDVLVATLGHRYPFGHDPAQAREIAGHLVDVLGELFDSVIGDQPGVWVEPWADGPLPTAVGSGAGMFVTKAQAGTAAERDADGHLQIEALLRISKVLGHPGVGHTAEARLLAVLEAFTSAERERLDDAARRDGLESFAQQVMLMLRSASGDRRSP